MPWPLIASGAHFKPATMSIKKIEQLDLNGITALPPKQMGKARLVFLEPKTLIVTPKMAQAWRIRPSDEKNEKFSLEVKVEDEAFRKSMTDFDMRIRKMAYENRKTWFGKAADSIESEGDLRQMHTMSIKKGSERADGTRYDDTIKFVVKGWSDYVEEVIYKGEGDKKWPNDVKWKSRLVDPAGHGGPDDLQTKFYICENRDMTTGKEQMAPWTPCQDPAGNQIKDAHGNVKWEFVGPKHCQPGCKLTIVFQASMVWLASKFGVTLTAKQVFITPAPAKPQTTIDGIEIVPFVDPILASKAARLALVAAGDDDDGGAPDDDDAAEAAPAPAPAPAGPAAAGGGAPVAPVAPEAEAALRSRLLSGEKKRPADAAEVTSPATKKSKKSKTVTVDDDF